MASGHDIFQAMYDQFRINSPASEQYVLDPGTGNTFDLKGRDNAFASVGAGTYKLPDNTPKGVRFTVYATGAVTLRTVGSATAIATLASGDFAECRAISSTTWGATVTNGSGVSATNVTVSDAGAYTDRSSLESILQGLMRDMQVIEFHPSTFVINGTTPLAAFADNAAANPGIALVNSEAVGVRFNNSSTQNQVLWQARPIPLSALSATAAPVLNVLASKTGATLADATTFVVTAFCNAQGELNDVGVNIGGTTSALTGNATAKTIQKVTLTMTSFAEGLTGPLPVTTDAVLSLSIAPTANTLNTDDVTIHRVWITFDQGTT